MRLSAAMGRRKAKGKRAKDLCKLIDSTAKLENDVVRAQFKAFFAQDVPSSDDIVQVVSALCDLFVVILAI